MPSWPPKMGSLQTKKYINRHKMRSLKKRSGSFNSYSTNSTFTKSDQSSDQNNLNTEPKERKLRRLSNLEVPEKKKWSKTFKNCSKFFTLLLTTSICFSYEVDYFTNIPCHFPFYAQFMWSIRSLSPHHIFAWSRFIFWFWLMCKWGPIIVTTNPLSLKFTG